MSFRGRIFTLILWVHFRACTRLLLLESNQEKLLFVSTSVTFELTIDITSVHVKSYTSLSVNFFLNSKNVCILNGISDANPHVVHSRSDWTNPLPVKCIFMPSHSRAVFAYKYKSEKLNADSETACWIITICVLRNELKRAWSVRLTLSYRESFFLLVSTLFSVCTSSTVCPGCW